MLSCQQIANRIDRKLEELVFKQQSASKSNVELKANVCCVCDGLLKPEYVKFVSSKKLFESRDVTLKCKHDDLDDTIIKCMEQYYSYTGEMSESWMTGAYLISPRTCV